MQVTIEHSESYAVARVDLAPGEEIRAEAGAMLAMKGEVDMETSSGGIMRGLKRAVLGGESFFQNTYRARGASTIWLAPPLPGDVRLVQMAGVPLIVQDGSYLASDPRVEVDTSFQGARGFFSGEGFVMLRVSGQGELLLSSYGAIEQHVLGTGERLMVDTGHLVAFTEGMPHNLRRVSRGLKSLVFSGEGIVSEFTGPGLVYTQSRSQQSFMQWLARRLPGGGGSGGGVSSIFGG
ncbi:MAG TPA: TIGR00266 family protein [Candidatus Thermoplasmatota archaeon]|nr:TIGR00266 family protein [Candidatus Thermoplasmatota archaeon]